MNQRLLRSTFRTLRRESFGVFALIALQRRDSLTGADRVLGTWGFAIYLLILPLLGWVVRIIKPVIG